MAGMAVPIASMKTGHDGSRHRGDPTLTLMAEPR